MAEYDLPTLARLARIQPRTVRVYITQKVLPSAVFRGKKTTYDDDHLTRILAIRHLLHAERLSFPEIRNKFARLSSAEIAALVPRPVARQVVSPSAAPAKAEEAPREVAAPAPASAKSAPEDAGETWKRVPLLPGLELHVSSTASPMVRKIARELIAQCLPGGEE